VSDMFEAASVYAQTYNESSDKSAAGFLTYLFEQAILAERRRCSDAVIAHCSYGHYMSEGTAMAALAEIDSHSAELHRGNVERFRAMLRESPPPTVHVGEGA
jgi:hypothetical protein